MTRRQSLKIITLIVFCFLSPIHAQDCGDGEYHCEQDTTCIRIDQICDDIPDCKNEEDEELKCSDTGKCIGPIKWCDLEKHCDNNDDENACCIGAPESPPVCQEDEFLCECEQECVPKCDGVNDCCTTLRGKNADVTTCATDQIANYTALDEENCPTTCPESNFTCSKGLPLECIALNLQCNSVSDCKDGSDEQACTGMCPDDQLQCSENLPFNCISKVDYCAGTATCDNGNTFDTCTCPECSCMDENNIILSCINEDEECPNDTEKSCSSFWWIWLIVILLLLLLLALLIWYFCKDRCGKKEKRILDPDAGSEESQPMQPGLDQTGGKSPPGQNGTISPKTPSPQIVIPPESPEKPSSPPPAPSPSKPDFDWEQAAQCIVKNHRKNTAHIHIPPENGFLMTEFPKDRIHEERSVSPQPAPVPTIQTGPKISYPQNLDRQISETGEVVRYAGPTQLPVHTKGKKSVSKTPFNYADPKDH